MVRELACMVSHFEQLHCDTATRKVVSSGLGNALGMHSRPWTALTERKGLDVVAQHRWLVWLRPHLYRSMKKYTCNVHGCGSYIVDAV